LRRTLLPRAPRFDPADLVEAGEAYARATSYPIQYQWTLLEGINDSDDELAGIVSLLAGKHAVLNFIPFNAGEGLAFRRPSGERAESMRLRLHLHRHGILTKLRQSAGQDVDQVARLNRIMTGWANYFCLGPVSRAYTALDRHAASRLRRWLCLKHKKAGRSATRFSYESLNHDLGLVKLSARTRNFPWAKA